MENLQELKDSVLKIMMKEDVSQHHLEDYMLQQIKFNLYLPTFYLKPSKIPFILLFNEAN